MLVSSWKCIIRMENPNVPHHLTKLPMWYSTPTPERRQQSYSCFCKYRSPTRGSPRPMLISSNLPRYPAATVYEARVPVALTPQSPSLAHPYPSCWELKHSFVPLRPLWSRAHCPARGIPSSFSLIIGFVCTPLLLGLAGLAVDKKSRGWKDELLSLSWMKGRTPLFKGCQFSRVVVRMRNIALFWRGVGFYVCNT